jgi:hypothetical protein
MKAESLHSPEALGSLSHEALRVMMLQLQSQSDDNIVGTPDTPPSAFPKPLHERRMRLLDVLDSALAIAAEVDETLEIIDSQGRKGKEGEVLKEKEGEPDELHREPVGDKDQQGESSSSTG